MYVADTGNHKIRKIDPSGNVTTFAGSGSAGSTDGQGTSAKFKSPSGVAVDSSGNVYVAILVISRSEKLILQAMLLLLQDQALQDQLMDKEHQQNLNIIWSGS